jgi:predicted phosphodiesterase
MRLAALYDIHGNLPALEAVLEEIRGAAVDYVVVGGDVVPGPMQGEALACLRAFHLPIQFIRGNGEREVLAWKRGEENNALPERFREVMRWSAQQLDPKDAEWLGEWPAALRLELNGFGKVLFCHATTRNDTDIFTRLTPEHHLIPVFAAADAALIVCGHSHMQFDRMIGEIRVVNAGSVGMPYGEPGAYWLLLGPDLQLRRTCYDSAEAAARISNTSFPQAKEFAQDQVIRPPTEELMLKALSKAELRF